METFSDFVTEELRPDDLMPWKVLGKTWHFLERGLVGGKKLNWEMRLLTELIETIEKIAPDLRTIWTNKVLVSFFRPPSRKRTFYGRTTHTEGRTLPDVVVHTKRVDAVHVDIYVEKNSVPLGRIRSIGDDPSVDGESPFFDILHFKFTEKKELKSTEFQQLLREALAE
jgi:excinuclease ABC subunit A